MTNPPTARSPLREMIERNEALYPDELHSVFENRKLTFSQYAQRVRRLAGGLERLGVRHQDRFAVLAMNCAEYVEAYGVAEMTGFVLVTVNWRLAPPEIAYVLKDSAPRVLVFESQYAAVVDALRPELSSVTHYVCIGKDAPAWATAYETVLESGDPSGASVAASASDILCLMYTSGTTGRPKGCMLSHANHAFMTDQSASYQGMLPGDRTLAIAPLFHLGARSQQLSMHRRGGCVIILRSFTPESVLRTIAEWRVTHVHMVPTMVQSVLDLPDHAAYDTSSLKCIIYAAAPMPVPVLRRAIDRFGRILVNGWGLTEGGNGSVLPQYLHRPDGTPADVKRLGSVGQPTLGTDVRVLDDNGRELPSGQVGEICLRSAGTMLGYWNNHPATVEALRGGWLHTGDVGYVDEQGFIFLVDRKKDMIISGGENIYCREVEEAIYEYPGVADAAVIGIPDPRWGEAVKAVVVREPGATFGAEELVVHCRTLIAGYKCPKRVEFVDALPRLPSGKVSKVALRAMHEA